MISEGIMHVRYFYLGHVTIYAVFVAYPTPHNAAIMLRISRLSRGVAVETYVIVTIDVVNQGLVRIVTGHARQRFFCAEPATTLLQSKRLESNCRYTDPSHFYYVSRRTMASPAEIHGLSGVKLARIQNCFSPVFDSSRLHRRNMI